MRGNNIMSRILAVFALTAFAAVGTIFLTEARSDEKKDEGPKETKELLTELKNYRHKIVYETNRDGNWELYLCNADGSNPVNLTNTKDVDEVYPKPSPDGTKICFCEIGRASCRERVVVSGGAGTVEYEVS